MEDLKTFHQLIQQGKGNEAGFDVHDGLLRYKRRLYINKHYTLKELLLREFHELYTGDHASVHHTLRRLSSNFIWEGKRQEVKTFIPHYFTCQTIKYSTSPPNITTSTTTGASMGRCGARYHCRTTSFQRKHNHTSSDRPVHQIRTFWNISLYLHHVKGSRAVCKHGNQISWNTSHDRIRPRPYIHEQFLAYFV